MKIVERTKNRRIK